MRYAILSDVHANAAALRAVLTDAADMHAERIVCLGDVLGYGPEPVEALELVYRRAHVCLAGNHDDAVSGRCSADDFTDIAAAAILRHRSVLAQKAIDWLRHLPYECEFAAADGGTADGAFACAHGDFSDPKHFDYVLEPADAMPSWRERSEQLLFVGHTHKPGIFVLGESGVPHALVPMDFVLEDGKRYLVNVGSVGYPRSGVCRSFYCIYDDQSRAVFFRSLPFDLEQYRAKMNGEGMDEAPWIEVRSRERGRAEVRGTEAFGIPEKKKKAKVRATVQVIPAPSAPARSARLGPALVIGTVLLVLGGVWCARLLVGALREGREEGAAIQAIEVPPEPAPEPTRSFSAPLPLSGGWSAAFEFPDDQKVVVDSNKRRNETAFRLTSGTNGVIRLAKTISLFSRPEKVCYSIRLLTTSRPGHAMPFGFTAYVRFLDAAGRQVDDADVRKGKLSVKQQVVKVPPGAENAELRIDCRCQGTFDLAVPTFGTEPKPASGRKK